MNELAYTLHVKANTMMNPHFAPEQTQSVLTYPSVTQVKALELTEQETKKQADLPVMFAEGKPEARKPRACGEYTKTFNQDFIKTGLRK